MKVCHFAATKGLGRGEAYVEIANALAEKIHISLLVPEGSLFLERVSPKVKVLLYRERGSRRNLFQLWDIYTKLKSEKPDLVHTHFGKATEQFLSINPFLKYPLLATKHNPRKGKIFEKVKFATAVSAEAGKSIKSPSVQVSVIRNALNPETSLPDPDYSPAVPFQVLAVGRLDPIKGFDLLIKALAKVNFPFHLSIAGEGNARSNLETLAQQYLPNGSCNFLGFRKDIPELMKNSALVVSSSHSEGCPMAMIEAFYYANCFLSTPVGEAADLLPPEFLCSHQELTNKLNEIHRHYQSFKSSFRKLAQQLIPQFSSSSIAEEYLKTYYEVLAHQTGSATVF
jgi:glycosyltransferase involved in cell wall biosynthesis